MPHDHAPLLISKAPSPFCATVPMGQVPTPGMFTPPSPGTFALAPPIPGTFGAFGASPGIPGTAPSQLSR
ncbi:Uncharacterised protein [Mycobacteroides abscessus subsp. abscessus]|nr:Uncharacterised protein [Mycobacteroides abscessus subsp. abscessus]